MTHPVCPLPFCVGQCLCFQARIPAFHENGGSPHPCVFPQPLPREAVTTCVDGGTLGVWGCHHDPGAGLPADANVLRITAVWASHSGSLLLWDAFAGIWVELSSGAAGSAVINLQNYQTSFLWLGKDWKVPRPAVAELRGAVHLRVNFTSQTIFFCLLLCTSL